MLDVYSTLDHTIVVYNHSSWKHHTITNDMIACPLLPAIALVHLMYKPTRAANVEDWEGAPTMDATFTVCMMFASIGPWSGS
jgi:hypothetical protein